MALLQHAPDVGQTLGQAEPEPWKLKPGPVQRAAVFSVQVPAKVSQHAPKLLLVEVMMLSSQTPVEATELSEAMWNRNCTLSPAVAEINATEFVHVSPAPENAAWPAIGLAKFALMAAWL